MDWWRSLGIVITVIGATIALVGLGIIIVRVRDDRRRTTGIRVAYLGMAGMCLGMIFFVLSRPDELLPASGRYLVSALLLIPLARLTRAAIRRRPPARKSPGSAER